MMYDHEKSDPAIVAVKPDEQSRATGSGVGGAKGGGRGECESAKHGPGAVPGNRVTGAEAHTARCENIAKRRHAPEAGEAMGRAGGRGTFIVHN